MIPWNKGKKGVQISNFKGKTYEEIYGFKEAKDIKERLSRTRKHRIKIGEIKVKSAENHYNWKGGMRSYRKIALENKGDSCIICGSKRFICIHHIDENYNNVSLDNLMVVCKSCHSKLHEIHKNINKEVEVKCLQ